MNNDGICPEVAAAAEKRINIAIAKELGYTDFGENILGSPIATDPGGRRWRIPDYCDDLNAMHEAEKTLTDNKQWNRYVTSLSIIVARERKHDEFDEVPFREHACIAATARQRAEAFLEI